MTRTTNARIAGFTYLFYIATAFPSMVLISRATNAEGIAAKLARVAQHASDVRLSIMLMLLDCVVALVLGVALYGITRDEDHELSVLALCCRAGEGVIAAVTTLATIGLLWLATAAAGADAPDAAATHLLGRFLLSGQAWSMTISASFFAVGSTIFSWLLLRGRTVPVALAWLGVIASVLIVVAHPSQLIGFRPGQFEFLMWLPMLAFEIVLGLWLLIKGVANPGTRGPLEEVISRQIHEWISGDMS